MLKVPKAKKDTHKPPALIEKLTLREARAAALRLQKEWRLRKHRDDLVAVGNWLDTTERKMNQVSGRLDRLKTWVDLYNEASEAAQQSIRLQEGWLSSRSSGEQDWQRLTSEIQLSLSIIKTNYGHCAKVFEKDSGSFAEVRAEVLHALRDFKDRIVKIEANLSVLREAQEDTKRRKAFKQIQREVENMVNCLIHRLCQPLYHAICNLVKTLANQIEKL